MTLREKLPSNLLIIFCFARSYCDRFWEIFEFSCTRGRLRLSYQYLRRISRYNIWNAKQKMSYPLSAVLQFLGPFRTRFARSIGTCHGPPSQPTSRKYARWRRSLHGRPFSMVDRPSANREPPAEIHLRCTSAKEFRRKELMRIKKGDPRAQKTRGSPSLSSSLPERKIRSIYSWKCVFESRIRTTTGINFRSVQIHFPRHRQRFIVFIDERKRHGKYS